MGKQIQGSSEDIQECEVVFALGCVEQSSVNYTAKQTIFALCQRFMAKPKIPMPDGRRNKYGDIWLCGNCGKSLWLSDKFCTHCGQKIGNEEKE